MVKLKFVVGVISTEINSLAVIKLVTSNSPIIRWFPVKIWMFNPDSSFAVEFKASCNPFVLAIVKLPSVMVACLVKISAVLEAISVVWVAVSVCKALVFCCSVNESTSNEAILFVLEAISVVWVAVSVCKAVVFGSSVSNLPCKAVVFGSVRSNLPCKAVISVSLEDIWVVWLAVRSSNPDNAVCNPSVLEILKSPSPI